MKKWKKKGQQLLATCLCALLLLGFVPLQPFAADMQSSDGAVNGADNTPLQETFVESETAEILYEDTQKRDAYTKVYKKSDGSYTAMVSSTPLHFQQDGTWVDIDNTLTAATQDGQAVLTNVDNPLEVALPETLSEESGVTLRENGNTITFALIDAQASEAELSAQTRSVSEEPTVELKTQSETAVYTDVLPDTNLEYSISSNSVKENIVIETPQAVRESYTFSVSAPEMTASCAQNGAVTFRSADGQTAFVVPAPFMRDAAGTSSTEISVALSGENGAYRLIYTPSSAWLAAEERQYPVIIDPAVSSDSDAWYETVCVKSDTPDAGYYNESLWAVANGLSYDDETGEISSANHTCTMYLRLMTEKLQMLTKGVTPTEVQLVLQGAGMNLAAYSVTEDCTYADMTYSGKPQYAPQPVDYYTGASSASSIEYVHFNITKPFYEWLSGETPNYGVAIYSYDDTLPASGLFLSEALSGGVLLLMDYVESTGYSESFDYHTQDVGRAGTSYIQDFSQNLFLKRDDIAISGNLMPVQISFLYNPALLLNLRSTVAMENVEISEVYGKGWLTNYNRFLYVDMIEAQLKGETTHISYAAENGNIIRFTVHEDENGAFTFTQEDTLADGSYTLTYDPPEGYTGDFSPEYLYLATPSGYTERFDASGRLVKIYKEKYPEQTIDIAYVSNTETDMNLYAIDSITDGAGRMYDFIYDSAGMLTEIQCKTADGTAIKGGSSTAELDMEYEYDEAGNLTEVLFPDGGGAYYTYDTAGNLTSADSRHMYKLVYTYSADGRVTSVTEQAQDLSTLSGFETGNSITITPNGPRQVTFSDLNGAEEIRQFDGSGCTVTVSDERGNFVDAATGMVHTRTQNILLNQSFEDGTASWTINDASGVSLVTDEAYHGDKAVKIDANQTDSGSVMQSVTAPEAGAYTFSAYIKAQSGFTTAQAVAMLAVALDAEGNELKSNMRTVAATSEEYARYGLTLEVPENTASVQVGVGSIGRGGVFYVDAVQLEKGSGFGAYNFLSNSGFYAQTDGVLESWQSVGAYLLNNSTQRVPWGDPVIFSASKTADYALTQTVELDGKQGDVLTFGGWIMADVVSNNPDSRLGTLYPDLTDFRSDRFAGFTISYEYVTIEDGETVTKTETVRKAAQDFITDWQYVSESVQLLGDCTEVTFSFEYENHPASVIVAAPALTLETGFAAEEIDETEIPEETTSPEESAEEAAPAASAQTASAQGSEDTQTQEDTAEPGCACEDCTMLGCTCTCESADVCDCPQCQKLFDITYDEYGNLLSISIAGYDVGQLLRMSLSRTFSASGNYLTTSTNESGGTVTYAYNENNGVLNSETDARGNVTEYTYNAIGALTQVNTPVSGLAKEALGLLQPTAMVTSYGYLNDRVTSITHNGYSYFIDYDRWSNVDCVYAGAADAITGGLLKTYVAEYTYGTGADHSRLAGITYGNGGTVHYRYDEYDRVTGISYDGGETYRFTYGYDTLGNLTLVVDSVENYIALYNETSVEIYRDGDLVYYVCADADGNLVEVVDGQFVYTTVESDPTRDESTGTTAQKTTVSGSNVALELLASSDAFGRKQQQTTLLRDLTDTAETPNFAAVTADYGYKTAAQGETTAATGQVDSMVSRVTYGTSMVDANNVVRYGFAYDYDANGNITNEYAVAADGTRTLRYRYTYDEANQLTRVDDNTQGKTHVYQYDRGGNRVSEKIYAYTLGTISGDPQQSISSYYGPRVDSVEGLFRGWYDVLRSYDGKGIQYDRAGNPVSYDGKTFTWNGKQLTKVIAADGSYTEFSYDANGLRTQKRQYMADGTLEYDVDYVWQDGLLTHQNMTYYMRITIKNETRVVKIPFSAKFVYDESNTPVGCLVNDEAAVGFVRNLQGDVIAVVTHEGDVLAEYSYDPWGKVTISNDGEALEGLNAAIMAVCCPFTYRGYNYDYTTGLYYLQSRYYNPEWGRFLNVDDTNILLATQGEVLGANLFAYCNNNPVYSADYTGMYTVHLSLFGLLEWYQAFYVGVKILEKCNYNEIFTCELGGFLYNIDKYNLVLFKFIFWDSEANRYKVLRFVAGEYDAWYDYINTEAKRFDTFNDFMKLNFDAQNAKADELAFSRDPIEMQNARKAQAIIWAVDGAVYLGGLGIINLINRSEAVNQSIIMPGKLTIGFEEIELYRLATTAIARLQSNLKPSEYSRFRSI